MFALVLAADLRASPPSRTALLKSFCFFSAFSISLDIAAAPFDPAAPIDCQSLGISLTAFLRRSNSLAKF